MLIDDNIVSFKYNHYTVCYSPTCKDKKRLTFAGESGGGSEGQKIMSTGLPHPKNYGKKGGCDYLGSV